MHRFHFLIIVVFACVVSGGPRADEDQLSGFAATVWTVNQLTRMELNEDGQLRLKRDHWEIAAKRPLPRNGDRTSRRPGVSGRVSGRQDMEQDQPPLEKLFKRIAVETGGQHGQSSSRSNDRMQISWSSTSMKGRLTTEGDDVEFELEETSDRTQSLKLIDNDQTTYLCYRSPTAFVRILRSGHAVHVCSVINGKVNSWKGHSFAEIVQQQEGYFRKTLKPLLKEIAQMPLDEAVALNVPRSDALVEFPPMKFAVGPLAQGEAGEVLGTLVRFHVIDGRLRFNTYFGDRTILQDEIQKVSGEFQKAMDRSVERLKKQDVSLAMISELKDELRWKQTADHQAQNVGRGFGGIVRNAVAVSSDLEVMQTSFNRLRTVVHRSGSSSSSGGNGTYSASFAGGEISAGIECSRGIIKLQAEDSAVRLSIHETGDRFELQIESETGQLFISDQNGEGCSILLVGEGRCELLKGASLASVVHDHEDAYRNRILPVLAQYRFSGMDPLAADVVAAIQKHLPTIPDEKMDLASVAGETDAYVLPLLNDAAYLKILSSRLQGDDRAAVLARIDALQ